MDLENSISKTVLSSEDPFGSRVVNVFGYQLAFSNLVRPLVFSSLSDDEMRKNSEEKHVTLCHSIAHCFTQAISEKNKLLEIEANKLSDFRIRSASSSVVGFREEQASELNSRFTSSLVQLKSGLDSLATTTAHLFTWSGMDTWGSRPTNKRNRNPAGIRIRNNIANLSDRNPRKQILLDVFDAGAPAITSMIEIRDRIHKGGIKLTGPIWKPSNQPPREVYPTSINIDGKKHLAGSLLESYVGSTISFAEHFLVHAIWARVGNDALKIVLAKNSTPEMPVYRWSFPIGNK